MVGSVKVDLAVGESAGTSLPQPSGGDNDEAKKFEEVSFIDGVLQGPQAEKVKAVLDEVYFEKGLGLDVGEEDLDTSYSAKGFGQLGQDVGVQRSKDKLDKVSLKKVVGSVALDEVSVEGCAGTKGGEAKVGEVLSEAAASQRGDGGLMLDSASSSTTAWPLERKSARSMLDSLPKVPYVEDCPDVVLEALASRPSRVRLQGVARRLPDGWIYIGRGSSKYGLGPSVWANPFRIGRDGDRDHCIELFRCHLRAFPALLARLPELRGKKLACHCSMYEGCHGDVLVQEFAANAEEHLFNADVTSDEDEDGSPKAWSRRGLGRYRAATFCWNWCTCSGAS